jgi:hypothetical protein
MREAAMAPSPTADATRFIEPWRRSPATNAPGWLDSKGYGFRLSFHKVSRGDRGGPAPTSARVGPAIDPPNLGTPHESTEPDSIPRAA